MIAVKSSKRYKKPQTLKKMTKLKGKIRIKKNFRADKRCLRGLLRNLTQTLKSQ